MSAWDTFVRIGRLRVSKLREVYKLVAEILESLDDEQKASLMMLMKPDQLEKAMKVYGIWNEFWSISKEEKEPG